MFNQKQSNNVLNQLRGIVQSSQTSGRDLPVTLYVKGVVVMGHVVSFPAYKLKIIEEAMKRQPELKESLAAMSERYKKDFEESKHFGGADTIVIRDAQVFYGNFSHRTPHWIGSIASVDAYEEGIYGERKSENPEEA